MSLTLPKIDRVAELQTVSPRMIKSERRFETRKKVSSGVVVLALARANVAHKVAAVEMGVSESLLSRQLKGDEHLSFQRLWNLPDPVWAELLLLIARVKQIGSVRMSLDIHPHQLKAMLPADPEPEDEEL